MKTKITITIISILLLATLSYIAYDKGSEWLENERVKYFNSGTANWNKAVIQNLQEKGEVPIILNNNGTVNLQSIKCNAMQEVKE